MLLLNVGAGALKWETELGAGWVRVFSGHLCFDLWNPLWVVFKQEPCFCHSKEKGGGTISLTMLLVFLGEVNIHLPVVIFNICCVFMLILKGKQT